MMPKKVTFEIWKRKRKNGKLGTFQFTQVFPKNKWQFALKLRRQLIEKGYEILLREVTVTNEEKLGVAK